MRGRRTAFRAAGWAVVGLVGLVALGTGSRAGSSADPIAPATLAAALATLCGELVATVEEEVYDSAQFQPRFPLPSLR